MLNHQNSLMQLMHKIPNRYQFPSLAKISDKIKAVPMHRRKFLSSVYLHCFLEQNSNSDSYLEYRSFVEIIGYSINFRALALYFSTIGAYLQPPNPNYLPNEEIFDNTLLQVALWLNSHNPYLRNYVTILHQKFGTRVTGPFPTITHIQNDDSAPFVNQRDIVIPTVNLPSKVHNKDFHYSRLMAGFIRDDNDNFLSISIYNPNLEPLLFLHLFSDGKGHFYDIKKQARSNEDRLKILEKYAKHMILLNDYRFRTDHYWPSHTYLQLEKLRYHQNT